MDEFNYLCPEVRKLGGLDREAWELVEIFYYRWMNSTIFVLRLLDVFNYLCPEVGRLGSLGPKA